MSIIGCANCGGTHYGSNECPYLEKNMGEPCVQCGDRTSYCCSDCVVEGVGKVYVCITDACRIQHEKKHPTEGHWILWFEDQDRQPVHFSGLGAKRAAHRTYKKMLNAWSCHLFQKVELSPELAAE